VNLKVGDFWEFINRRDETNYKDSRDNIYIKQSAISWKIVHEWGKQIPSKKCSIQVRGQTAPLTTSKTLFKRKMDKCNSSICISGLHLWINLYKQWYNKLLLLMPIEAKIYLMFSVHRLQKILLNDCWRCLVQRICILLYQVFYTIKRRHAVLYYLRCLEPAI